MTATLVDSNVLIDVLSGDPVWAAWSGKELSRLGAEGPLVINPVIYAEVSHRYTRKELLDHELPADVFVREDIPWVAASSREGYTWTIDVAVGTVARRFRISSSAPTPQSPDCDC